VVLTEHIILINAKYIFLSTVTVFSLGLAYLGIDPVNFTILTILILVDILTGFWKGIALRTWSSKVGSKGLIYKLRLLAFVLLVGLLAKMSVGEPTFALSGLMFAAGVIEVISIVGNMESVIQKKEVKEVDAVSILYSKYLCKWLQKFREDSNDV